MSWGLALLWFGSGIIAGIVAALRVLRLLLTHVTIVSAHLGVTQRDGEEGWQERLWLDYKNLFFTSAIVFDMSPELKERMRTMRDLDFLPPNEKLELAQMVARLRARQETNKEEALKQYAEERQRQLGEIR